MALSSTIVVCELQNYYTKFLSTSELNKYSIPSSVRICDSFLNKNSFLKLLFDDNWIDSYTSYRYMYREDPSVNGWPAVIRERTMIYPVSSKVYVSDSDDSLICPINAFLITRNDCVLLDALLKYRLDDSTSLIVVDSSSVIDPTFVDTTSSISILTVNYPLLSTLSKLIFLYLNLQVNRDISYYNNDTILSNPYNLLESLYESYVLEKMFKYIADQGR